MALRALYIQVQTFFTAAACFWCSGGYVQSNGGCPLAIRRFSRRWFGYVDRLVFPPMGAPSTLDEILAAKQASMGLIDLRVGTRGLFNQGPRSHTRRTIGIRFDCDCWNCWFDVEVEFLAQKGITMKSRFQDYVVSFPLLCICIVCFLVYPEIDLHVSRYFYNDTTHLFPGNDWPWVKGIYLFTPEINKWVSAAAVIWLAYSAWRPQPGLKHLRRRCLAWLLMVTIGIGFVVDWALKDHFGRPHPYQTINFNGTQAFVPVLHYQPLCEENCSFVSGHAAGGFVWLAWGMWSRRQLRRRWIWTGLAAGTAIGLTRIIQGGHFLSDVLFSGWFIWLVYLLTREVWLRWRWRKIHIHALKT